jgi:hypothetical protein
MVFEPNAGQTDPAVDFISRGPGYTVFLNASDAVLKLSGPVPTAFRMSLGGRRTTSHAIGVDPLASTSHYFIGNDPARWTTGVPNFGRVRYEQVYRGIDLVYYGSGRQLEYDFVVSPHADPAQIQLAFSGMASRELAADGALILSANGRSVRFHKPVAYQHDPLTNARTPVEARFVLRGVREAAIDVGHYDTSRPLVIDPVLIYSSYVGTAGSEFAYDIAVDASGNAYVTGFSDSATFPVTSGAFDTSYAGSGGTPFNGDVVVSKFSPAGALIYSTYLGGSKEERANSIAVDSAGNVYITGSTTSTTFPTTPGVFQPQWGNAPFSSNGDSFVTKLNPTGSALVYSTFLSGHSLTSAFAIAVDAGGNAYVTGQASFDFPSTSGSIFLSTSGGNDAFAVKLNASGTGLLFSRLLGGTNLEDSFGIAVDASGNSYVTGCTDSSNFPLTSAAQGTYAGATDAFAVKLGPTGATVYSTFLGGAAADCGGGVAVDTTGAYFTGKTSSANFPVTSGVLQTTRKGSSDAFVTKLSASGAFVYSTYLGGSLDENGSLRSSGAETAGAIALDVSGNAFVTGFTYSTDFPLQDAIQVANGGGGKQDVFVSKLNSTGSALIYSTYLGGSGTDEAYGIAVLNGDAYIAGRTTSSNLPMVAPFQSSNAGGSDMLIARLARVAPTLTLTPATLNFAAVKSGTTLTLQTAAQTLSLSQSGTGTPFWTVTKDQPWITVSPASGSGPATITVSINNTGNVLPSSGALSGTVTIVGTGGTNSPTATINLTVLTPTQPAVPVGVVDTPTNNQTGVTGSLPVTGWVIDDLGVTRVRIWRGPIGNEGQQVFIGDAAFVDGARPDIAGAFPTTPFKDRAGWGYMMLTNFLPNQGNGTFTLYVYAEDVDGHTTLIGTKTITCSNSTATQPFGAIDLPAQGGTVSGSGYANFGWVLAGQKAGRFIPTDGSTITVVVDSAPVGAVDAYNLARPDIQALFPGYVNTDGAVGVKTLDFAALPNGTHTIAWVATDNLGAAQGIGSRYFTVANSGGPLKANSRSGDGADRWSAPIIDAQPNVVGVAASLAALEASPVGVAVRHGFDDSADADVVEPDANGVRHVRVAQLNRLVLDLDPGHDRDATYRGYLIDGHSLRALPVGSHLDTVTGEFAWAPGLGFGGTHALVFVRESAGGGSRVRVDVAVDAEPARAGTAQMVIDTPQFSQILEQPFTIAGWAFDPQGSSNGSGIDTLHVWAYPTTGAPPIWVGVAAHGGQRPDVAAAFGSRFLTSGFAIQVATLPAGTYDLVVYAHSAAEHRFTLARVIRVTIQRARR